MDRVPGWLLDAALLASASLITLWMAAAIYFDVRQSARGSLLLAAGWTLGVISLFAIWHPLWQPFAVLVLVAVLFTRWWLQQKPSHCRDWDPSVAVLPR